MLKAWAWRKQIITLVSYVLLGLVFLFGEELMPFKKQTIMVYPSKAYQLCVRPGRDGRAELYDFRGAKQAVPIEQIKEGRADNELLHRLDMALVSGRSTEFVISTKGVLWASFPDKRRNCMYPLFEPQSGVDSDTKPLDRLLQAAESSAKEDKTDEAAEFDRLVAVLSAHLDAGLTLHIWLTDSYSFVINGANALRFKLNMKQLLAGYHIGGFDAGDIIGVLSIDREKAVFHCPGEPVKTSVAVAHPLGDNRKLHEMALVRKAEMFRDVQLGDYEQHVRDEFCAKVKQRLQRFLRTREFNAFVFRCGALLERISKLPW
ncbi:hypothetical protein PAPHI01_0161 [Pancytospora philotis]|nr:hypothetical protein PAPHI01_0161 [Pancytospora philotis]